MQNILVHIPVCFVIREKVREATRKWKGRCLCESGQHRARAPETLCPGGTLGGDKPLKKNKVKEKKNIQ